MHKLELEEEKEMIEMAVLEAGYSFGELALVNHEPRSATIKCLENCYFAVLSRNDFEVILGKSEKNKLNEIVKFFQSQYFLNHCAKPFISKVINHFKLVHFKQKQVILSEGEEAKYFYLIQNGNFKFTKKREQDNNISKRLNSDNKSKKLLNRSVSVKNCLVDDRSFTGTQMFQLAFLGRGEIFGHGDLINRRPNTMTCICVNDGSVYQM